MIHFLKDFDYRVSDFTTIAYVRNMEVEVEDDCATLAVSQGAAMYSDILEDDLIEGRSTDFDYDDEEDDA